MLAVTQDRRRPVRTVAQAHPGEQRTPWLAQFRFGSRIAPEMKRMAGVGLHRQCDIVEHAEIEEQRGDLERARQAQRAAPIHRQRGDVVAGKTDAAGIGPQLANELGDQRSLAGAVRPDHRVQLAGIHAERKIVGGDDALEALGQVVHLQQRLAHRRTFASSPTMPPRANSTTSSSSGPRIICQYSVMPDSASSSTSSATAPISGPTTEPMPPSTTMTLRSPERVQCIMSGLTNSVWLASSAPASPHIMPAMTKQTSR